MTANSIPPTVFESFAQYRPTATHDADESHRPSWSRAKTSGPAAGLRDIGRAFCSAGSRLLQRTPAHEVTVQSRELRRAALEVRADDVEQALAGVADLNRQSKRTGDTALHHAAGLLQCNDSVRILHRLIESTDSSGRQAELNLINKKGETALSIAEKRNNHLFFHILLAAVKKDPGRDVGLDNVDAIGVRVGELTTDPEIRALIGEMRSIQKQHVIDKRAQSVEGPIYATVVPRHLRIRPNDQNG